MQFFRRGAGLVSLAGVALALSAFPARAQGLPSTPFGAPEPAEQPVPEVGEGDLPTLSLPAFGAVSLRASLAAMQATPTASQALLRWVGQGNVVFLHTDAAQLFGMQTVTARAASADEGGQLFGRARAAVPFGAHPLLCGAVEAGAVQRRGADPTRLPGVQTVFYSLREGDALVTASDAATPLLRVEGSGGEAEPPLYAAAIVSVGAGWAIFCPDSLDSVRGDGALFGRALRGFVPDQNGARWVGLPSRVLGANASPSSISAVLFSRIGAALQSDGRAALPGFGTAAGALPAPIETGSEPVLPLQRDEARAILNALGGPDAVSVTALLAARMQWQLGHNANSVRALGVAATDPLLAAPVGFLNGCFAAQVAGDFSLDAPSRVRAADAAARSFSLAGSSNFGSAIGLPGAFTGTPDAANGGPIPNNGGPSAVSGGAGVTATMPLPVAPSVAVAWSREFARLAAIYTLAPPQSQFLPGQNTSATLRFYGDDPNAAIVATLLQSALQRPSAEPRARHVEVLLLPSIGAYDSVRRALSAPSNAGLPGGEVVGNTLLLASGGNNAFDLLGQSANASTLARGLALANLNSWSDGARPLPTWVVAGVQGRALALAPQGVASSADPDVLAAVLNGNAPASPAAATALWDFLIDQYGTGASQELVARLAAGAPVDEAIQAATGDDLSSFEDAFRRRAGA